MAMRLVAVGKIGKGHLGAAAEEYAKRIRRHVRFDVVEVGDEPLGTRPDDEIVRREDERVVAAIPKSSHVILADRQGKKLSSEEFARLLEALLVGGKSDLTFVLGGTLGAGEKVRERADETVSFSQMTMAHGLARVVLLEQTYRAFAIMRGEKYHR